MTEFYWDKRVQRYRYKQGAGAGQFVSNLAVESLTRKAIANSSLAIKKIAAQLEAGEINLATWEVQVAQTLKNLHLQNYLLGKGGKSQMSARDYGLIGQRLRTEYSYLRKFSQEIQQKGVSSAQLNARLQLYVNSTRGLYEKAKKEAHTEAGYQYERRVRHVAESCLECTYYESLGWQPIGVLPDPTERCSCRVNCKCTLKFSRTRPDSFGRIKSTNFWDLLSYDYLRQRPQPSTNDCLS